MSKPAAKLKSTMMTLAALALALTSPARAEETGKGKPKRLLFFTKSSGYEHAVIKVKDGVPSLAHKTLEELGAKNGFVVTHSKDGGVFTAENIAGYDGFVFFTSGDLTAAGNDKNPPMSPEGKAALLAAVESGKGFVGIHQATGTFPSPGDRFLANDPVDPYIALVGGEFIFHGVQQTARVLCTDARFPGVTECGDKYLGLPSFELMEEWYSYKNFAKDLHVIHAVVTWSLKNTGKDSVYRRPPYPITWARRQGKGRVFYTGLGHRDDVWASARFQNLVVGGIKWATGVLPAKIPPNIAAVTPGFDVLPPNDVPPAPAGQPAAAAPPAAPVAR